MSKWAMTTLLNLLSLYLCYLISPHILLNYINNIVLFITFVFTATFRNQQSLCFSNSQTVTYNQAHFKKKDNLKEIFLGLIHRLIKDFR